MYWLRRVDSHWSYSIQADLIILTSRWRMETRWRLNWQFRLDRYIPKGILYIMLTLETLKNKQPRTVLAEVHLKESPTNVWSWINNVRHDTSNNRECNPAELTGTRAGLYFEVFLVTARYTPYCRLVACTDPFRLTHRNSNHFSICPGLLTQVELQ